MVDIKVLPEQHIEDFVKLSIDAYPGMGLIYERDREKLRERIAERCADTRMTMFGAFRGDRLVGAMRTYDYTMNYRGALVPAGGLGGVAVDLTAKRERVAGDMVAFYLDKYDSAHAPFTVLWPFRPDFYRKMGFGYGGQKFRYSLPPGTLPESAGKQHVDHARESDLPAITRCYTRLFEKQTGMLDETEQTIKATIGAAGGGKAAVYRDGDNVRGFMLYRFVRDPGAGFLANDLHVEECLYESPAVLGEFLAFLHAQRDQVRRILLDLPNSDFHYAPIDPRNDSGNLYPSVYHECASFGIGVMYRVLDVNRLFTIPEALYGPGGMTVTFAVRDDWWGRSAATATVRFGNQKAEIVSATTADLEVTLDIADFSSLVLGAASLSSLVEYGRASVSDSGKVAAASAMLATPRPPYCMTRF